MKIERIDDKTVKCFISHEELEEYDIDYKDFLTRSEKAREVVKDIIEQAEAEVGYKPPQFAFDLQIMMLPDKGLVLTFSEKDPFEGKEDSPLLEYLKEMKKLIGQGKEAAQNSSRVTEPATEQKPAAPYKKPIQAIFVFDDMRSILKLADAVPGGLRIRSELYEMNEQYYLYIDKGAAAYEKYSKVCIQAMEFGSIYAAEEEKMLYIKEHGTCLIAEHALRKLGKI